MSERRQVVDFYFSADDHSFQVAGDKYGVAARTVQKWVQSDPRHVVSWYIAAFIQSFITQAMHGPLVFAFPDESLFYSGFRFCPLTFAGMCTLLPRKWWR